MSATSSETGAKKAMVAFDTLDEKVQSLLKCALVARKNAYTPYSKFAVGACVQTEDGQCFGGCNVENASYTVGTCAERCALFKAISNGHRKFTGMAVVAQQENFITTPCGACRQMMNEFGNYPVYIAKTQLDSVLVTSVEELLPLAFQYNTDYSF